MSLKQLLRDHRDDILARFVRDVRGQERAPPPVPQSVLIDHIPAFLEEIVEELVHEESLPEPEALAASGRRHGEQRWRLGEDIEAVVREYGTLRHAIYEEARAANVPMSLREFETLARCLNLGIAGATAEYVRLRDSQSEAQHADLELIGEAGEVLGSSIDYPSTLSQLFGLLLPRLADFCVVQLDGRPADQLPIAHVQHGQIELLRELVRRFEPDGLPGRAEVSKLGKAVLLEWSTGFELEQFARAPEHRAYLEQLAARSFLVAPLRIHARTIGTLTIGSSESERRYKASDMLLVGEVARRAASAIDNARLYELSRSERVRAEAATRAKDEFVAVVSHELRTPLNVIIGWTRLLRSGSLSDKTREHALEVVERNAAAQNQLVADLLDISRVLTGKVRLDPAQLDLGSLLRLVLEDARLALEAKRLRLHVDIGDATLMRGDADRLKQVVWNLLLNAIKFTQKGGEIHVSLRKVESDLELIFEDDGIGIAGDVLPHVFESFRQSDSRTTRSHGGLGIGLSISKHLVDLHGGTIEASSEGVGKGARFTVRLPVSPVISTTIGIGRVPVEAAQRPEMSRRDLLAGMHVLVVDDEDDARDLLRITLESCGARVSDAASAREALALLAADRTDVVVSDIGMPEEDGYSLIRAIRALEDPQRAATPAIALTAFARNEDRTRALLAGFNVHMAKPVEPAELLVTIADLGMRSES